MFGVDLSLFQFDGDLTFAAFLLNADRTIYGRYGTAAASLDGFKAALEAALELHARHPEAKAALAGKTGPAPRWPTPEAAPVMAGRYKRNDVSSWGCIHCHTAHEGVVRSSRRDGLPVPDDLLWKYPPTENLGLRFDPAARATLSAVVPGSAADRAGLRAGDAIELLEGQPLVSSADVRWILHRAPDEGALAARVRRGGRDLALSIGLEPGWRRRAPFVGPSRPMTGWFLQMTLSGMIVGDLDAARRRSLGLAPDAVALEATFVALEKSGFSHAARLAGIAKGDVIVEVDGLSSGLDASAFVAHLYQKTLPGQQLVLEVLRGRERKTRTLTLP